MQIYIRRDNEEFGPYSREAAMEYMKQGIFEAADPACYAGMTEWKPVGVLLGIEEEEDPGRPSAKRRSEHITAFDPAGTYAAPRPRRRRKNGARPVFLVLAGGVLIVLVLAGAYLRWGGGSRIARHYLSAFSMELAKLANGGVDENPPSAAATPAPDTGKTPAAPASTPALLAASSPSPASATGTSAPPLAPAFTPATSATSALAAVPSPALDSSSAPAVAAAASPVPAASPGPDAPGTPAMPLASSSDAAIVASGTTPTLESASSAGIVAVSTSVTEAASPAPPVPDSAPAMAASPGPDVAAASTPGQAPGSTPPPDAASAPSPAAIAAPAAPSTPRPPPATPRPFDPAEIASNPGEWPKSLKLKQAAAFPVLLNSQVVGSVTVPAGTVVTMVSMQGNQLTLQCRGLVQTLPWAQTDLKEEYEKNEAALRSQVK